MSHLTIRDDGLVQYVTLNRPDVRNAFNEELIAALTDWARTVAGDDNVASAAHDRVASGPPDRVASGSADRVASGSPDRAASRPHDRVASTPPDRVASGFSRKAQPRVAVLSGNGKAFCAGADLGWMSKMVAYSHEENLADARLLAGMYDALDRLPIPLVGRIHGAALGGGVGLAAVCDIVVAAEDAVFGFTEVKLGIVPAVISPFVLRKIGASAARELFLTGGRFSAARAKEIGLVHAVAQDIDVDRVVAKYVNDLLSSGPEAVAAAKALIRGVGERDAAETPEFTVEAIARQRVTAEGQEGMHAFLEKRPPSWTPS